MKVRGIAIVGMMALLTMLIGVGPAIAQVQTGEITGRVTDDTGAVLPGVSVTLSGPALIQAQSATSTETGSFRFPSIPIGTYTVKFELPGFKTVVREGIQVTIGFTANVTQQLAISTVQETVTVSGESPIVDTKATTAKTTFDLESLQNIPSARDPWVMLQRVPNISMDRVNVGGSQSGQQSNYISRGATGTNNKWSLDGVDITDMSATGASPMYYDFDMMQEMQVTTGGADASQQTGGVGINFVTRSGTNRFKGSGRIYNTNERFEADNVTDEIRTQGGGSGAPIQNINDVGFEVGGPIMRDKLWYWGSYGKQDIKVGVVNFYKREPQCRPVQANGQPYPVGQIAGVLGSTEAIRDCLATDLTTLDNYNWKVTWAPVRNNKFNFQNTWGGKVRNARDASDTRPIETAYRQKNIDSAFETWGWNAGPVPIWKASDQHVLTDRLLLEVQYAHVGNNFTLTFQDPAQSLIQPRFDIGSSSWARSFDESVFIRPTNSIDVTTSYFLPATFGGDHAFKAGYRWRTALGTSISHTGGNAVARFANSSTTCPDFGAGCNADLFRDGYTSYQLATNALYVQDTFSVKRLTLNLGVRWDHSTDEALPTSVSANPIIPQIMPAIEFPGIDGGASFNDISPRLGMTYDLFGTGKSVARASYSMYFGQMAPGQLAGQRIAIGQVFVRYPWADTNGDTFVQANELQIVANPTKSAAFDPANPTSYLSPGRIDPDLKNDRTREFIVGLQQEIVRNLAIEVNYVWRKYDQFTWTDRDNFSSADFELFTLNTPSNCGPTAECPPVQYYRATKPQPSPYIRTNQPDRWRDYNGVEFALIKRYSDRWAANVSFAWNKAVDQWGSLAGVEDPTNIPQLDGASYAPEQTGSGVDNVFNNAEWLFKASGQYTLPLWDISVAGSAGLNQGYPYPQQIAITSKGNGLADTNVFLVPLGDIRLPNLFVADFRVDKAFNFGGMRIIPSLDVFNLTNSNETLARRRTQYSYNATTGVGSSSTTLPPNNISAIIAPRVIRFGARVTW